MKLAATITLPLLTVSSAATKAAANFASSFDRLPSDIILNEGHRANIWDTLRAAIAVVKIIPIARPK